MQPRLVRAGWLIAVPVCLVIAGESTRVAFRDLGPTVIQQRLALVPRKLADRKAAIESLFHEAGCEADRFAEQPVPHSKAPNQVCTLLGQTTSEIVVGGHYDSIEAGMGAVDDWSGAALLASLYQSLDGPPRRHRIVFVAFAGEEGGLLGSREFVRKLAPEELHRVRAMLNLECLGAGPPQVWASRADPGLLNIYLRVVYALHLAPSSVNVDRVGDDDSHPFLNAGIPVLTIHSLTQKTLPLLHNSRDNLTAIHAEDYYTAYRLAATYLAYLDTVLE